MRWAERLIPNFSILCRSVFGCIPRVFAARLRPLPPPSLLQHSGDMSPLNVFQGLELRSWPVGLNRFRAVSRRASDVETAVEIGL